MRRCAAQQAPANNRLNATKNRPKNRLKSKAAAKIRRHAQAFRVRRIFLRRRAFCFFIRRAFSFGRCYSHRLFLLPFMFRYLTATFCAVPPLYSRFVPINCLSMPPHYFPFCFTISSNVKRHQVYGKQCR